jgi:8-hydroxy-5-deazaflavin:NADPH oxidoreductase
VRIAVLGTGEVGRAVAGALVGRGHEVRMGSRTGANEAAAAWAADAGERAGHGTFADAAGWAELVVNCTGGGVALAALRAAGAENLAGKVVVDVSNPLDFSHGRPPILSVCNTTSVAEQLQEAFPQARVVKTLNTVNNRIMVDPARLPGRHTLFVCGNDPEAKAAARGLLEGFGWPPEDVLDLGDLTAARGMEMYIPLWLRLMGALGGADFNIAVVRAEG